MKKIGILLVFIFSVQILATPVSIFKENIEDGVYIVNGDTPVVDLNDLESILNEYFNDKLIVNTLASGVLDVWDKKQRFELSYCVSDTFKDNKEAIVKAMKTATADWMKVANVKFIYRTDQDDNCDQKNEEVLFDIRPVSFGRYIARAFFPDSKRSARNVLVDKMSFGYSEESLAGFIRHELGHVLGFRHEHIHEESPGKCNESGTHKPVTDYDNRSVMHYPQCGGLNDIKNLVITETDAEGAEIVYP
jgi:hypothetical protein